MNFYIDSGGTIIACDPEQVYQGSAMANTIRLIAPFPLGASVTVSYILPDGTQMQPQLMTANKTLSGVQTETGVNFSVWEQNIGVRFEQVNGAAKAVPDFMVLSQVGNVGVVFTITQANAAGQAIKQTTARSSFLCERGAALEMPPEAFDDYESLLNQILGQLSVAVQNSIDLEENKVNRAGDDKMTGEFVVTNGRILLKKDPSEGHYAWLDPDMLWFNTGFFDGIAYSWEGISYAWREENDPTKQYTALISIPKKSGTMAIQEDIVPQIDKKVNRSGDIMTGILEVDDPYSRYMTDYTAQGVDIIDEHNRDYTSYKKDSIRRVIADGDEFEIKLPTVRSKLATESQIQDLDEQLSSAIDGIREDIRNEAHFRGYVATNAEIQALKADNNDYAYSAESGTVWIYQGNAWTNSGRPVPDQSTPASNSTPLMDGTANAGIAESYSRADHVHPTDTTLAKTIDGEVMYDGIEKKNLLILRLYNASNELIKVLSIDLPQSSGGGEGGTIVTVDGIAQGTWDADTKVGFTDYASTDKAGIVKTIGGAGSGIKVENGIITIYPASKAEINNTFYYPAITSLNIGYATKYALAHPEKYTGVSPDWTDEDKAAACETIGAVKKGTSPRGVYARIYDAEAMVALGYANSASVNSIPFRGLNGSIYIPTASIEDPGAVPAGEQAINKKYVDELALGQEAGNYSSLDEMISAITSDEYGDLYSFLDYLWQNRNN